MTSSVGVTSEGRCWSPRFARPAAGGHLGWIHKVSGLRDPAAAFPFRVSCDDARDRRAANRATAVSAAGLGATGLVELLLSVLTGSVGLLGDAIHNLPGGIGSRAAPHRVNCCYETLNPC